MMPNDFKDMLGVLALLISIGGSIYAWLTRSGKEAGEKAGKLDARLSEEIAKINARIDVAVKERDRKIDELEDRISRAEGELRHLPDRATVHRLELSMAEMKGDMRAIAERLMPVSAIADRLQEFLLEQAKR